MATIDMTHRKLNFPPRFLPYLEKHRIFELLHECVELLVQVKPRDHIQFLKNVLPCAAKKKDKQRIVFLSPVSFDRTTFSELLADCLGIQVINLSLMEMLTREKLNELKIEVISESVEEESCICRPESGYIPPPTLYYPSPEEESYYFDWGESVTEKEEEKEQEEEEKEQTCICVCPCVKEQQEEEEKEEKREAESAAAEQKQEEEKEQEKEGEAGESQAYPCEPYVKKKGRHKRRKTPPLPTIASSTTETTPIQIDFGILAECEHSASGWILEDFPMSGEDAERLNAVGIIPTHALRIIIDEEAEAVDPEYRKIVKSWMNAYKYVPVLEIRKKVRNMPDLVKDMCSLLSVMPHRHAPMLPRVVLIGSRGSGVTTQGQKLAYKYGIVHVEFETVISRALQQDDEMCKLYKLQMATRVDPELEALLLERALLTPMCRNRGWVLTGYPRNIDQMRMLDMIATPPNRVIFVEVQPRECFVRLFYRKFDPCLGNEYKMPTIQPSGLDSYEAPGLDPEIAKRLLSHPKNDKKQIIHDIEQHFLHKKDMMTYCGKTASYVDGNQEVDRVFEQIEQIIINPAPPQPPRDPLSVHFGIDESYKRLKKFRLASGMFFNNMLLNPPERLVHS